MSRDDLTMMYLPCEDVYRVLHQPTGASVDVPRHGVFPVGGKMPRSEDDARRRILAAVRDTLLSMRPTDALPTSCPEGA